MFDILVYLYETYYRPDACPNSEALIKKLSAVGFEEDEISKALDWLTDLAVATNELSDQYPQQTAFSFGTRIYVASELDTLGTAAVGFIQFLESAKVINPIQREIVIERALAVSDETISLDRLKVIVLMVLWSQGKEPDSLMFDELFLDEDDAEPRMLH
jgi:Smg protein